MESTVHSRLFPNFLLYQVQCVQFYVEVLTHLNLSLCRVIDIHLQVANIHFDQSHLLKILFFQCVFLPFVFNQKSGIETSWACPAALSILLSLKDFHCHTTSSLTSLDLLIQNIIAQGYPEEACYTRIIEVRPPLNTYYHRTFQGLKPTKWLKALKRIQTIKVRAI